MKINIFWFRRDLRLEDKIALDHALRSGLHVDYVRVYQNQ